MDAVLLLVALAAFITCVVRMRRERRWLREVERASGDPEALARLIYGPHRNKRRW